MEDIEKLKEENDRLQNRLKKAVEVFKEQKDDIVRLTGEKEDLTSQVKEKDMRIEELEGRLKEKTAEDDKFFEMIDELDSAKEANVLIQASLDEANKQIAALQESLYDQTTDAEKYKKMYTEETTKLNAELSNARASIEKVMNDMSILKDGIFTSVDEILSNANEILSMIDVKKPAVKKK